MDEHDRLPSDDGASRRWLPHVSRGAKWLLGAVLAAVIGVIVSALLTDRLPGRSEQALDRAPQTSPPTPNQDGAGAAAGVQLPDLCVAELSRTQANPTGRDAKRVASIKVHRKPAAITVGRGYAWVAHTDGRITRIPLMSDEPRADFLRGVRVGSAREGQVDIAYDFEAVWVTKREKNPSRAYLARIDASGEDLLPLRQADNVATGGGFVWVTREDGRLTRVTPGNWKSSTPSKRVGGEPHGLWAESAPCVYASKSSPDGFVAFDAETFRQIEGGTYLVGGPDEIVAGAKALWLLDQDRKSVLRVDPKRPGEAKEIDLGVRPRADALAASDSGIWTADGNQTVIRVDPSNLELESIRVGGEPRSIAIGGDPERVWIVQYKANRITAIRP